MLPALFVDVPIPRSSAGAQQIEAAAPDERFVTVLARARTEQALATQTITIEIGPAPPDSADEDAVMLTIDTSLSLVEGSCCQGVASESRAASPTPVAIDMTPYEDQLVLDIAPLMLPARDATPDLAEDTLSAGPAPFPPDAALQVPSGPQAGAPRPSLMQSVVESRCTLPNPQATSPVPTPAETFASDESPPHLGADTAAPVAKAETMGEPRVFKSLDAKAVTRMTPESSTRNSNDSVSRAAPGVMADGEQVTGPADSSPRDRPKGDSLARPPTLDHGHHQRLPGISGLPPHAVQGRADLHSAITVPPVTDVPSAAKPTLRIDLAADAKPAVSIRSPAPLTRQDRQPASVGRDADKALPDSRFSAPRRPGQSSPEPSAGALAAWKGDDSRSTEPTSPDFSRPESHRSETIRMDSPRIEPHRPDPPRSETAQHIARQIAGAVAQSESPGFDLALDPEELGKVRMRLVTHDGTSLLIVHAERPETLDLMRRHIATLEQDLRAQGYEGLTLRFSGGSGQGMGEGGGGGGAEKPAGDAQPPPSHGEKPAAVAPPAVASLARDHLDLRL